MSRLLPSFSFLLTTSQIKPLRVKNVISTKMLTLQQAKSTMFEMNDEYDICFDWNLRMKY